MTDTPNRSAVLPFGDAQTINHGEEVTLVTTCLKPFMLHRFWFNPDDKFRIVELRINRGPNLLPLPWNYDRNETPPWLPTFIPKHAEVKMVVQCRGETAIQFSVAGTGKLADDATHNE